MSEAVLKEKVIEVLKKIYDPEIPVSIYDLGLIYELNVSEEDRAVSIKMGVTTPLCPVTLYLASYVEQELKSRIPELKDAKVEVVFDPPWDPSRITPAGRERLKQIYGYDVVAEMLARTRSTRRESGEQD
uniref:Metal-sulfur cluster assembly factor n=1 Tax=Fervidicoccus fontis TaxID=683846 RepID=A0A7J3ZIX2_9CREN